MRRVFCSVGGGICSGALLASFLSFSGQIVAAAFCFLCFILAFLIRRKQPAYAVFLLCCCCGLSLFAAKDALAYQPALRYADTEQTLSAELISQRTRPNGGQEYRLKTSSVGNEAAVFELLLYTPTAIEATNGDRITLTASLRAPRSNTFDGIRYYKSQNIYLLASAQMETVQVTATQKAPFLESIRQFNVFLGSRLEEVLSPTHAAVVKSMVLGDRSELSTILAESYIASGSYHLFSVSGLHLSILLGALLLVLRPLGRRFSSLLAIPFLLCFILLSGIHLSTVRSGFMVLLLLVGRLFYRRSDPLNSLWFAGACIVLGDVYAILDLGFLLSMSATFGIVWVNPRLQRIRPPVWIAAHKPLALFWNTLLFSTAVTIPMLPIYLYTFQRLSLVTPLANLLVLPVATLVLLLGFVLCVLLPFGTPTVLALAEGLLIDTQNALATLLAKFPFSNLGLDYPAFRVLLLAVLLLLLCHVLFHPPLWKRVISVTIAALCTVSLLLTMVLPQTMFSLYVVGDGAVSNLIFLYGGQCTVVSMADNDYIDRQTLSFLRGKGIDRVENFISAYRSLNAYTDTQYLLSSIPVEKVFYHRENKLCEALLSAYFPTIPLVALQEEMTLDAGFFRLQTTYENRGLTVLASYGDTPIFIGTPTVGKNHSAALYFYKTATEKTEPPYPHITWVLKNPYKPISVLSAYDRVLAFHFNQEGQISWKEE